MKKLLFVLALTFIGQQAFSQMYMLVVGSYGQITTQFPCQSGTETPVLIIDPNGDRVITAKDHYSNADYSLFEGWEVKGKPYMTLLRGQVLLNQGTLEQNPGYGIFLECEEPRSPLGGPVV